MENIRRGPRVAAVMAVLYLSIACAGAWAADEVETIAVCHRMGDKMERVGCYDRVTKRQTEGREEEIPLITGLLAERWGYDQPAAVTRFEVNQYGSNYVMFRGTDNVNKFPTSPAPPTADNPSPPPRVALGVPSDDNPELAFQISVKARIFDRDDHGLGLWLAYTQQSFWQIFDAAQSRPFRETNYQPEAILAVRPELLGYRPSNGGFNWRLLNFGLAHQSNGQGGNASRSWNRAYAEFGFEHQDRQGDSIALLLRPWYRFKEDPQKDENPDITDYYGHGDVRLLFRKDNMLLSLMARGNLRTGKGAGQIDLAFPLPFVKSPREFPFKGYVQLFSGYGESLIDYNWRQTTFGVGVMLNDRR